MKNVLLDNEKRYLLMSMKFGVALPSGASRELAAIKDPVKAYEAMTDVARTAEDAGFDSIWISDVLWSGDASGASQPSQEFLFECWTTTAALARDTRRVRIGQMVT